MIGGCVVCGAAWRLFHTRASRLRDVATAGPREASGSVLHVLLCGVWCLLSRVRYRLKRPPFSPLEELASVTAWTRCSAMRPVSAQLAAMLAAVFAMLSRGARASGSSCELVYLDIGSNIGDSLHAFAFHRPANVLALARSSASPHHERRVALYALPPPDSLSVCLPPSLSLSSL